MRTNAFIQGIMLTLTIFAFVLVLSTCGGSGKRAVVQGFSPGSSAGDKTSPEGLDYRENISLDNALADLDALETPEGVDSALFAELKDALEEALVSYPPGRWGSLAPQGEEPGWLARPTHGGKFVSTPPAGEANRVDDLAFGDDGEGNLVLTWHYWNLGDYDQNGVVGIADITPIAMHYGETYEPTDVNCIQAVVDGSGNYVVDIADITPLAMNFGTECAEYALQHAASAEGEFTEAARVPLPDAADGERLLLSLLHTLDAEKPFVRVVPYDGESNDGVPSDTVEIAGEMPHVSTLYPRFGVAGSEVTFAAAVSGVEPLFYAWDFGGGAEPNVSDEPMPVVTLAAEGEYNAVLTLRNSFGVDECPFLLSTGVPPEVVEVTPTEGDCGDQVAFSAVVTGTEPITYAWDFGGGAEPNESSESAPTVTLAAEGEYNAVLTLRNSFGVDEYPFLLTTSEPPVPPVPPEVVEVTPTEGDSGDQIKLSAVVTGTGPITLAWNFGGGAEPNESEEVSPTVVLGEPGGYDASVTASSEYGNDTYEFTLAVREVRVWQALTLDSHANGIGGYTSLAVVNGSPAFSYSGPVGSLRYVRATAADGSAWGSPVIPDSAGSHTSLAVVDGNPAISYFGDTNEDLKYIRATDANGDNWGTPVTIDSEGNVGWYTSLAVVNGYPAISYCDVTNADLKYVRASDANGSTWEAPVILDSTGDVGWCISLAVVSGNPAVSCCDVTNGDLQYVRANDASGSFWGNPHTIDRTGYVGWSTSLAVVNGNPAISYYDYTNLDLKYVRASDADGSAWGDPVAPDSEGNVGFYTSLAVIDGNPAISYFDWDNISLKYVWAIDANGESWFAPVTVDVDGGEYTSLAVVNGNPAISYRAGKSVRFTIGLRE